MANAEKLRLEQWHRQCLEKQVDDCSSLHWGHDYTYSTDWFLHLLSCTGNQALGLLRRRRWKNKGLRLWATIFWVYFLMIAGTKFKDIDLSDGEFAEYDEMGNCPVAIYNLRVTFEVLMSEYREWMLARSIRMRNWHLEWEATCKANKKEFGVFSHLPCRQRLLLSSIPTNCTFFSNTILSDLRSPGCYMNLMRISMARNCILPLWVT